MSTVADERPADARGDGESPLQSAVGAANTLLFAPSTEASDDHGCGVLSDAAPPAETAMLWVTYSQSPDDRLAVWRTHVDDSPPTRAGVIDVGGATQSGSTRSAPATGAAPDGVPVEAVSPSDLTGLGIALTTHAPEWGDGDGEFVVCFHSLSVLLQYVGLRQAFRFLHSATGCLRSAGATAHYHMDPTVHDERTLNTVKMLFDAVVEPDDDGWDVTLR